MFVLLFIYIYLHIWKIDPGKSEIAKALKVFVSLCSVYCTQWAGNANNYEESYLVYPYKDNCPQSLYSNKPAM